MVRILGFHCRARVQSLVRELRSHKLCGVAKNKKNLICFYIKIETKGTSTVDSILYSPLFFFVEGGSPPKMKEYHLLQTLHLNSGSLKTWLTTTVMSEGFSFR